MTCPISGEPLSDGAVLAPAAWASIAFVDDPVCARCGAPFSHEIGEDIVCGGCLAEPPHFDSARAAVVYDDKSHGLIVSYKHADRTDLTPLFVQWLARAGAPFLTSEAVITPTPLHRGRLFTRRYNQAALLAAGLSRATGLACDLMALERLRATPPQKNLSGAARRRNVAGAFAVRKDRAAFVQGRRFILVDDVLTTGSTLSACARALKKAGAARVDALVLARVVRSGAALS